MGFARKLILFLFEREHEGYKRFAACTVTLSSIFIPHCHSFNSHFKFFTFILTHASLRIILSFEGDEVYKDR